MNVGDRFNSEVSAVVSLDALYEGTITTVSSITHRGQSALTLDSGETVIADGISFCAGQSIFGMGVSLPFGENGSALYAYRVIIVETECVVLTCHSGCLQGMIRHAELLRPGLVRTEIQHGENLTAVLSSQAIGDVFDSVAVYYCVFRGKDGWVHLVCRYLLDEQPRYAGLDRYKNEFTAALAEHNELLADERRLVASMNTGSKNNRFSSKTGFRQSGPHRPDQFIATGAVQ